MYHRETTGKKGSCSGIVDRTRSICRLKIHILRPIARYISEAEAQSVFIDELENLHNTKPDRQGEQLFDPCVWPVNPRALLL
jgi:hypothetical protein